MNINEIYERLEILFDNDIIKSYYIEKNEKFNSIDIEFLHSDNHYKYQIILDEFHNSLELIKFDEFFDYIRYEDDYNIIYLLELKYLENNKLDYISIIFYELKNQYQEILKNSSIFHT